METEKEMGGGAEGEWRKERKRGIGNRRVEEREEEKGVEGGGWSRGRRRVKQREEEKREREEESGVDVEIERGSTMRRVEYIRSTVCKLQF